MPKIKTNRAAAKRFKLTAKGKVRRRQAGLRHINTTMSSKHKRRLRKPALVHPSKQEQIKKLIPYA